MSVLAVVSVWSLWASAQPAMKKRAPRAPVAVAHTAPAEETKEAESDTLHPMNWFDFSDPKTPPYIAMLVNFAILAGGLIYFGKAPVAAALQQRRDAIAKGIEDAQRMKVEAEARAKTYEAKLLHLDDDVRATREALVRVGEAERDRILAEADAKAQRMRNGAEFLVEQEIKQLRQDMWRAAVEEAVTSAEKLLREGVTAIDQERLAEEYLRDLGSEVATIQPTGRSS
jgi:F-type H+-transporting ATPase subunit b